jgi:K+-sensing histidine kinase KdpD
MVSLADILGKFEEAMASSAFAEEGEFEMALQFMGQGKNAHKRVLLGTDEEEIDPKIIVHALKLCQRMEAGLEILHIVRKKEGHRKRLRTSGEGRKSQRAQGVLEKMGIVYKRLLSDSSLESELMQYVTKRRDLLCVVLGAKSLGSGRKNYRKMADVFERLRCPLVIYG